MFISYLHYMNLFNYFQFPFFICYLCAINLLYGFFQMTYYYWERSVEYVSKEGNYKCNPSQVKLNPELRLMVGNHGVIPTPRFDKFNFRTHLETQSDVLKYVSSISPILKIGDHLGNFVNMASLFHNQLLFSHL